MLIQSQKVRRSKLWLHQVKLLMSPQDDNGSRQGIITRMQKRLKIIILSRFVKKRTCKHIDELGDEVETTDETVEFIEPLTLHGRHPFSFASCQHIPAVRKAFPLDSGDSIEREISFSHAPIMDVDYILLQSNNDLYYNRRYKMGTQNRTLPNTEFSWPFQNKHFLIDAGASTFDSSLAWFACAYSQVRVINHSCRILVSIVPFTEKINGYYFLTHYLFS